MTEPKLSSVTLLRDSATEIYRKRTVLVRAVILPILSLLAIRIIFTLYLQSNLKDFSLAIVFLVSLARLPFYVILATACHRIIILGDDSLTNRWGIFWSMRETRFVAWLIVLGCITAVISIPLWYAASLLSWWTLDPYLMSIPLFASILVSTFIDGRLSLVLPATAIGRQMNLMSSWKVSAGHGWPVFIALLIPILATRLIDYVVFDFLFDSTSLVVDLFRSMLFYPLIIVGVVIITLAYRNLVIHNEDKSPPKPRRKFYFE